MLQISGSWLLRKSNVIHMLEIFLPIRKQMVIFSYEMLIMMFQEDCQLHLYKTLEISFKIRGLSYIQADSIVMSSKSQTSLAYQDSRLNNVV